MNPIPKAGLVFAALVFVFAFALLTRDRQRRPAVESMTGLQTAIALAPQKQDIPALAAGSEDRSKTLEELWNAALAESEDSKRLKFQAELARYATFSDIKRLLEWTAQLPDSEQRLELRRLLLVRLARSNGPAAIMYVQTLAVTERPIELVASVLGEWATVDLPAAIQWFAQTSKDDADASTTAALADGLARQKPERIVELIQLIGAESVRTALCAGIVERWRDENPIDAANLVVNLTTDQTQADLLGQVVPQWGQKDLTSALRWVQQLPPGTGQTAGLIHVSYTWIRANPAEAAAYARDSVPENEQFLTTVISQWAQQDRSAAAEWAQRLPEGASKHVALTSLVASWAQHDPRRAAEFASQLPPGTTQQAAVISAVSAWAAKDPATAAQWVASFPTGRHREYAIENVFHAWTQTDPIAAVNWLARLPAGSDRDTAVNAGAGSLVDTYPDLAAQLAAGIGNEALRNRQTERAVRAWLAIDPGAARTWIQQSNLPPALKRQLLPTPTS